nr:SpoIIE family protein phosphatase [Actinacidiphila paucisporea]
MAGVENGARLERLAGTVARLREQVQQAHATADGRALIEMAKGILVERLHCGPQQAATQIADLAAAAGVSSIELAADIVNQAAHDRLAAVAREFLERVGADRGRRPGADDPAAKAADAAAGSLAVRLRTAESGALAAFTSQAVAQSVLDHALRPLGATAVAVWSAEQGASLRLVGHAGFAPGEAELWHHVPPGVVTPARRALTVRGPVWLRSLSEAALPTIGQLQAPHGGRVALPTESGGRLLGVLEIAWPDVLGPQPPAVHRQIEALAELVAHTIDTGTPTEAVRSPGTGTGTDLAGLRELVDGLLDPAMLLRPRTDAGGRLIDFRIEYVNARFADPDGRPRNLVTGSYLLESYPFAAEQGNLFDMVEHVHATGEPFRATGVSLIAVVGQVQVPTTADVSISRYDQHVVLIWRVEDETARLTNLLRHAQRLGRIGGFEENLLSGQITWNSQLYALYGLPATADPVPLDHLTAHSHPDDAGNARRFLRGLLHHRRPADTAVRLQRPDGVVRHVRVVAEPVLDADQRLIAVRGAYQDISAQHWAEVALAATRDQLAHSEQRTADRNRLAKQLQQAIMPPVHGPIDTSQLAVAVRYRPAENEHLVGGDWYDAVVLPSQQVLISVGDVAGHGIKAATGMVALRHALRGLATTGAGPGQILSWLNLVAHHLTDQVMATAICGLYDPPTRTLRWARAGHLPPLLLHGGRAINLPMIRGILLGAVDNGVYEEAQVQLQPGDTLLMYTDGLIERKDRSLRESLEQLLATAEHPATGLDQRLDHLLIHSNSDTDDDTCIVGIQVRDPS